MRGVVEGTSWTTYWSKDTSKCKCFEPTQAEKGKDILDGLTLEEVDEVFGGSGEATDLERQAAVRQRLGLEGSGNEKDIYGEEEFRR